MKILLLFCLLAGSVATAGAEVYRCEAGGKVTYTDQACAAAAQPAPLPGLTAVPAEAGAPDLARQYDAGVKRDTAARDQTDQAWLKRHDAEKKQDAALRSALIEHRVIKGMTPDQVQQALNLPQKIDGEGGPKERWIYQNQGERRTIGFKDGVVSSNTVRRTRK